MYALFHKQRQISKAHKHRICAIIEAYERGVVMTKVGFDEGWEVRRIWTIECAYLVVKTTEAMPRNGE